MKQINGAGEGNRTLVFSLEGCNTALKSLALVTFGCVAIAFSEPAFAAQSCTQIQYSDMGEIGTHECFATPIPIINPNCDGFGGAVLECKTLVLMFIFEWHDAHRELCEAAIYDSDTGEKFAVLVGSDDISGRFQTPANDLSASGHPLRITWRIAIACDGKPIS